MALEKKIELQNGVILNYHRIVALNKITNLTNIIEVNSYVNKEQRQKEKKYQEWQKRNSDKKELTKEEKQELEKGINVFIDAKYINLNYDKDMTIEQAYNYLKTLENYKESKDILEEEEDNND